MLLELSESQTRQQIDSIMIFTALEETRVDAIAVRGGMFWREVNGKRYLIRTSSSGGQTSLGPESPETIAMAERFLVRKQMLTERRKMLEDRLGLAKKLNRAHEVGRVPNIVVGILNELSAAGLGENFLVVGTSALYAYEAAAGVRVPDVDLFMDTRKGVQLFSQLPRVDSSMIGLLRKVDKSFTVRQSSKYKAQNSAGFEVDVIRDPHPLRLSDDADDLWAGQVASGDSILRARPFEQVVISSSGAMARMRTIHPLDFARIKEQLSQATDRDPLKRRKDALQAQVAREIVLRYLPHLQAEAIAPASEPSG